MSLCNTLNGVAKNCLPNTKGIKTIYLADLENIDSIIEASGNITAITMVASPVTLFQKYSFRKTSGSNYVENQEDPSQGFDGWIQTLTLVLNRREINARNEIQVLAEGFRDLVAIVEDNNGIFWYFGAANGVNLTATTGGSETANYTLTFTGMEHYQAYTTDSGAVTAVTA